MSTTPQYYFNHGQKLVATDNNDGTKVPHVVTGNITGKFREAFEVYTPGVNWDQTLGTGDLVYVDGNAAAASYLVISKSPLVAGTETRITCQQTAEMPVELAVGMSMSQRTLGQEFSTEIVDTGAPLSDVSDLAISSIQQATTTLTINTTLPHGLSIGKSIGIYGCADSRMNYPALVVATVPTPNQITVTAGPGGAIPSVTAGPFASGFVFFRERLGRAEDGTSLIFEQPTATQASLYTRSEAGDAYPTGTIAGNHSVTVGTSTSVQLVAAAYTYSFGPTTEYKLTQQADRLQWSDVAIDSVAGTTNRLLRTSVVPSPSKTYELRFRAVNNDSLTIPVGQIVSVSKAGSTTATFVMDRAHNLTTTDVIVLYGVRNQTDFPNQTAAIAVASIVSPTSFTAVITATTPTITSYGGYVAKVQGGNLMSALGAVAQVAQNATLSTLSDGTRQLVLTGNAAWAAPAIIQGDVLELVGCRNNTNGATLGIDGAWKVATSATTSLTLVLPYANSMTLPADFAVTDCGGALIKRTELRISYVRLFDYERERVEIMTRPTTDVQGSVPVQVTGGNIAVSSGTITTVSTVTTVTGVTTVSAVTSANLAIPGTIADVASAALTSSATVAAITPTFGISYQVNIPVTAVTGTNPTLDVSIEESDDSGTNWYKVYDFQRITAAGIYRSPVIPLVGNRVRYVQTVGGTTPSFTRAVNRLQSSYPALPVRQLVDRSVVLTTLNSTTPTLNTADCGNRIQLVVNIGAVTTTAPALQLEGSDDFGTTWYSIGSPLTAVASSTVQLTVVDVNSAQVRARVSTAGVGVTAGYVMIKAHD